MLVLGWHGNPRLQLGDDAASYAFHDAAAVILRDGAIVAAIEEERLTRVKHSSVFPANAIRFCLAQAGATFNDVEVIVTDIAEEFADFIATREAAADTTEPFASGRSVVARAFEREFHVNVTSKIRFCSHHIAHLHSAWQPSGFTEGLAVCLDGDGDGASGLIATFANDDFRVLRHLTEAQSLGNFYMQQLCFLGYQRFDEYKAMGLAPYGNPAAYEEYFRRLYSLQPEGRFEIAPVNERLSLMGTAQFMENARRRGEAFTQAHKDFAAGLQTALERIVEHVVDHFQRKTAARYLCISGGVGHNCTLNGKLLRSDRFARVYVQPAAHDAGNALGAALAFTSKGARRTSNNPRPHVFFGSHIGTTDSIGKRLTSWSPLIRFERVRDAAETGARLIASGAVIAWVQGRSEFGPRALGNRSILADPRPAENKRIINAMVKKREAYRPFAPAVVAEKLTEYFDVPAGTAEVPFMVIVLPVRQEARALLGAVTHIDGSARVQSVAREDNERFHALISTFGQLTGVPVVLNTSFNNHAEPIVDSIDDAVTTFLTTGIDALIVGDWLIHKASQDGLLAGLADLLPKLSTGRRLVRRPEEGVLAGFRIEAAKGHSTSLPDTAISRELFNLLLEQTDESVRERCERQSYLGSQQFEILREMLELWTSRLVVLSPRSPQRSEIP